MFKSIKIKFNNGSAFYLNNCIHINISLDDIKITGILDGIIVEKTFRIKEINNINISIRGLKNA